MTSCDAAVVGAGPAGCSAALRLARRGLRVVLADKAAFPRPKPCGEGVMPEGVAHLADLGVLDEVEREGGRRFYGIRYVSRRGAAATGYFAAGRYGITARREALDAALLRRARSCPGVRVLERCPASPWLEGGAVRGLLLPSGRVRAGVTLFADGAGSLCARALGLRRRLPARRRFGLRARLEGVEGLGRVVEVFLIDGGELYLVPQGEGRALVALLLEEPAMARFAAGSREAFLAAVRSCAPLAARVRGAGLEGTVAGAGPLGGRAERCQGPGWLLAGDAAGGVDPVTGDGISLALESGRLAARAALGEAAGYARERRRMLRGKRSLERLLLAASRKPWLAELLLAGLGRSPRAFTALLSV